LKERHPHASVEEIWKISILKTCSGSQNKSAIYIAPFINKDCIEDIVLFTPMQLWYGYAVIVQIVNGFNPWWLYICDTGQVNRKVGRNIERGLEAIRKLVLEPEFLGLWACSIYSIMGP
jgi:hypothetical protein